MQLIVLLLFASSILASRPPPVGIYCSCGPTTAASHSVDATIAQLAYVDGILVRIAWSDLEPTAGNYNWAVLDNELVRAASYNKKVALGILSGPSAPTWLYSEPGAEYINFTIPSSGLQVQCPVPWNDPFLTRWTAFIAALGARYDSNTTISLVHITHASQNGLEMQLPPSPTPNWNTVPYDLTKHIAAVQQIIQAFSDAFPNTPLDLEVHPVLATIVGTAAAYDLANAATQFGAQIRGYSDGFGVFSAWWSQANAYNVYQGAFTLLSAAACNATASLPNGNAIVGTFASAQYVTSASSGGQFGPGGIMNATSLALSTSIRYLEIWNADLLNSSYVGWLISTWNTLHSNTQQWCPYVNVSATTPPPGTTQQASGTPAPSGLASTAPPPSPTPTNANAVLVPALLLLIAAMQVHM